MALRIVGGARISSATVAVSCASHAPLVTVTSSVTGQVPLPRNETAVPSAGPSIVPLAMVHAIESYDPAMLACASSVSQTAAGALITGLVTGGSQKLTRCATGPTSLPSGAEPTTTP